MITTHHNKVATTSPKPIQSINTTHKRNLIKPKKWSFKTIAKPTDDTEKKCTGKALKQWGKASFLNGVKNKDSKITSE